MPIFSIQKMSVLIPDQAVLLDTNVIVSAFNEAEGNHEDASVFVFDLDIPLLIPLFVVVEAWGVLVGSQKKWLVGWDLLTWIATPGNATLIADSFTEFATIRDLVKNQPRLDLVDAALVSTADRISDQCKLNPPLAIATYDTADFLRIMPSREFRFGLCDVVNLETIYI